MNDSYDPEDVPVPDPSPEAGVEAHRLLQEKLIRLLDAPRGTPAVAKVMTTACTAITSVIGRLPAPNGECLLLRQAAVDLSASVKRPSPADAIEAPSALKGLKHKHPFWCLLAQMQPASAQLAGTYAGLLILKALHRDRPIPASGSTHLCTILREEDLSVKSIDLLLSGYTPDTTITAPWLHSIQKLWRDVIRAFSMEPPPAPSPRGRVVSELMSNLFAGTSARHAGATSHRDLSRSQVMRAFHAINANVTADTLHGTLGVLVCITRFSVEVVARLEILDRVEDVGWPAGLLIQEGTIKIDLSILVNEPARALKGCIPSGYMLTRPLLQRVVSNLRRRIQTHPNAKVLQELYPEERVPDSADLVYSSSDEIAPSWARLRRSSGIIARQEGLDCLGAFIVNCDLTHIPRSKLHYASVSTAEIFDAMSYLYGLAGWGQPEPLGSNSIGFGCRVVPTLESLRAHDGLLVEACNIARPGNHPGLHRLLAFHNSFIRLSAWRIAVLLALREATSIDVSAAIDKNDDGWIPIHDKVTPNDRGQQPVPLCSFARKTISSVRRHCHDMQARLSRFDCKGTELERWCDSAARGANVRLLGLATDELKVAALRTSEFTRSLSADYELPPDVGRKVMENHLRHVGLPSTLIDAVLRHSIQGQHRLGGFSNSSISDWSKRTAKSMDHVAQTVFGSVIHGLSKE